MGFDTKTPQIYAQKKRHSTECLFMGSGDEPGRFQPSTISVLRLNFCVRDGNRWIPQAIVTGNSLCERLLLPPFSYRQSAIELPPDFGRRNSRLLVFLSRQSAVGLPPDFGRRNSRLLVFLSRQSAIELPPDFVGRTRMCLSSSAVRRSSIDLPTAFSLGVTSALAQGLGSPHPQNRTGSASRSPDHGARSASHILSHSLSPRSSPRPISIIKLHALLRFHR